MSNDAIALFHAKQSGRFGDLKFLADRRGQAGTKFVAGQQVTTFLHVRRQALIDRLENSESDAGRVWHPIRPHIPRIVDEFSVSTFGDISFEKVRNPKIGAFTQTIARRILLKSNEITARLLNVCFEVLHDQITACELQAPPIMARRLLRNFKEVNVIACDCQQT